MSKALRFAGAGGRRGLRTEAPAGHAIISPSSILTSLYHTDFRADDPFRVMNGAKVAGLYNYGGDASDALQASSGRQPTYGAAAFNSGPGLTFATAGLTLIGSTCNTPLPPGGRFYVWLVAAKATGGGALCAVDEGNAGSGINDYDLSSHCSCVRKKSAAVFDLVDTAVSLASARHLVELGVTVGGTATIVVDGVTSANAAHDYTPDNAVTHVALGDSYFATALFPGSGVFARVIVASGIPSGAQLAAMRTYLQGPNFPNYSGSSYGLP